MIRKFLFLLLLSCLIPMTSLLTGCTSSGCRKLEQHFESCGETWIKQYGIKKKNTCSKNTVRKDCGVGLACVTPTGQANSYCYMPGNVVDKSKAIIGLVQEICNPVFTDRQTKYMECLNQARCDIGKIRACSFKLSNELKKSKKKGPGPIFVGFILFLLVTLIVEGLFVFIGLKISDKRNPSNSIVRALVFAAISGVVTFPLVYFSPLVGMLVSSSLMFGILVIFYHTEMLLPSVFTGFHLVYTFMLFTWLVSSGMMGGSAWLGQPQTMRLKMTTLVGELNNYAKEITKDKKAAALAKKRAILERKREEKRKKEQAALKAKQAKDKKDAKDKKGSK
jgi:hypothetical protein